VVWHD
jgi:hypothetical protein